MAKVIDSIPLEIASKSHQSVKMQQHPTVICLNPVEMIYNLSQDSDSAGFKAQKPIKYTFTGVVEELDYSN